MEFEHSEKVRALQARVTAFMAEQIYPNEEDLFAQVSEGDRWDDAVLVQNPPFPEHVFVGPFDIVALGSVRVAPFG
jgi:hypothetical protein